MLREQSSWRIPDLLSASLQPHVRFEWVRPNFQWIGKSARLLSSSGLRGAHRIKNFPANFCSGVSITVLHTMRNLMIMKLCYISVELSHENIRKCNRISIDGAKGLLWCLFELFIATSELHQRKCSISFKMHKLRIHSQISWLQWKFPCGITTITSMNITALRD